MNAQQNIELVRQAYAAYGRGAVDEVLACMSAQIEWEIPGPAALSFTGKRRGADQVAEYFGQADEHLAVREFTPREFIAQGDKVVVLGHGAWTAKDTGQDFESDWVHIFTIQDGRIAVFREFMDAHIAAEAFQCFPLAARTAAALTPG
jgi:ketosteroid isomerase-like protein